MSSPILVKGQNISLPDEVTELDVIVSWVDPERNLDASALLVNSSGHVRSDADFVFYNQPESEDATVRYRGSSSTDEGKQERVSIHLDTLAAEIDKVVIAGSSDDVPLGDFGKLSMQVRDQTGSVLGEFLTADASSERALVFRGGVPAERRVETARGRAGLGIRIGWFGAGLRRRRRRQRARSVGERRGRGRGRRLPRAGRRHDR